MCACGVYAAIYLSIPLHACQARIFRPGTRLRINIARVFCQSDHIILVCDTISLVVTVHEDSPCVIRVAFLIRRRLYFQCHINIYLALCRCAALVCSLAFVYHIIVVYPFLLLLCDKIGRGCRLQICEPALCPCVDIGLSHAIGEHDIFHILVGESPRRDAREDSLREVDCRAVDGRQSRHIRYLTDDLHLLQSICEGLFANSLDGFLKC